MMNEKKDCQDITKRVWIIWQRQHFLFKEFKTAHFMVFDPFIGYNKILPRLFRIVHFHSAFPLKSIWYRKLPLNEPDLVVIREGIITEDYLGWLRERLPNTKIVVVFMNRIKSTYELELAKHYNCEVATGDPHDCVKYDMNSEMSAVYLRHLTINKEKPKYDVFYAGAAKNGRKESLDSFNQIMAKAGINVKEYLTSPYPYGITFGKYKKKLSYAALLNEMRDTKSILHLCEGASSGITIRLIESAINKIKLITNDESIVDTPIYNKNNVLILGKDDIGNIRNFLDSPFEPIDQSIIDSFYFETWVENYLNSYGADEKNSDVFMNSKGQIS